MNQRVVITGLGIVSPIGNDIPTFEANLRRGVNGEGLITHFSTENFPVKKAFEVKNFTPLGSVKRLDPFIQYAVSSANQALEDAGIRVEDHDPFDIGIVMSSSKGGLMTFCREAEKFMEKGRSSNIRALFAARVYSSFIPNIAAQWIARQKKIRGPAACYVSACATGTYSVSEASEMVRRGDVKICIAGATDASICPLALGGYYQMGVYSRDGMRPFDKNRTGFQVGEGAACVILEPLDEARKRGAKIYAEIGAHACGNDCYSVIGFNPKGESLKRVLELNLKREGLGTGDISYINLHGTATWEGDIYEIDQLRRLFGEGLRRVPMSATKSMTGHMLGSSGAVEIVATVLGIAKGFFPPTANIEALDENFADLDLVRGKAREGEIKTALTYSLGFGGHIASLILKKYEN